VDALAGLETGGIPIVTMLSQVTGLPALFVRKEAKTYGTCRLAEGGEVEGRRLFIVEDVITSGGAVLDAVAELRNRGGIVEGGLCVIDRESGGLKNLAEIGVAIRPLFTMTELKSAGAN
jgi:orotate phosphoribosyltransferase